MKDLDKNKKYDLSQLNDEQLKYVLDWLKENFEWDKNMFFSVFKEDLDIYFLRYYKHNWSWSRDSENITNALVLFGEDSLKNSLLQEIEQLKEKALIQGLTLKIEIL